VVIQTENQRPGTAPVLALFLAFQRSFINSIASSGVKG
jgi:multiple sugar transport system permease protein